MSWHSELAPGVQVFGLIDGEPVEIVAVNPVGEQVFATWRDEYGVRGSSMLSREQVHALTIVSSDDLTLDADPALYRLAADALRLAHAHQLNPLLALTTANVEPLPHQVQAVYHHLLRKHPQRFLLADDPGAGKTVMAGLFLKEAMARGWVRRCLIVVPGSLTEQWQDELLEKFGLRFEVFDAAVHATAEGDAFAELPQVIVRLDQFARSKRLRDQLSQSSYDLAIVDEAHKLTARYWGSKVLKSKRFEFGEQLRDQCPGLLLMTATPHNGKEADFRLFLSLLDEGLTEAARVDLGDAGLMRRLVKEQLVHADGTPLFPPRKASTVGYRLSGLERDLYEDVTEYVREEMNKVTGEETRTIGFALLVLQRRLASSPEAILRSLTRRRDRLRAEADRMQTADTRLAQTLAASLGLRAPDPEDDWTAAELSAHEDDAASVATTARTLAELEVEVAILDRLVSKAERVRSAGLDAKWEALAALLQSDEMYDDEGGRRKIIIFTEHRDTLEYLEDRLRETLGASVAVESIHGATSRPDRRLAQIRFTQDPSSSILLATDAAGEGVNLQVAHLMVNYDIPWNPNRLEQRFGRIHRIGQRHTCHLWNLVAVDTREGEVFRTLLEKLERQRDALGDRVFDVLGDVLTDASLTQLLTHAIRGGTDADSVHDMGVRLEADLREAVAQRERSVSSLTEEDIRSLRVQMTQATARSLQPTVVRDFVGVAMSHLRGELRPVGRYWSAAHVPARVRDHEPGTVAARYDALTFERVAHPSLDGPFPELISPGHPLVHSLTSVVLEDHNALLRRGVVLEDERAAADHVLVSMCLSSEGLDRFVTVAVHDEATQEADPAGFSDLPPGGDPTSDELTVAERAVEQALNLATGPVEAEILAVAYVRGTAPQAQVKAWDLARSVVEAELSAQGVVTAAPRFAGWDLEVETKDGIRFVRVEPEGVPLVIRRQEGLAESNLGPDYLVVRPRTTAP